MTTQDFIDMLHNVSEDILPIVTVILLIFLIVFVKKLLDTMKKVNDTIDKTNALIEDCDAQVKKLDAPLATIEELSHTVDEVHATTKTVVNKVGSIAVDTMTSLANHLSDKLSPDKPKTAYDEEGLEV